MSVHGIANFPLPSLWLFVGVKGAQFPVLCRKPEVSGVSEPLLPLYLDRVILPAALRWPKYDPWDSCYVPLVDVALPACLRRGVPIAFLFVLRSLDWPILVCNARIARFSCLGAPWLACC